METWQTVTAAIVAGLALIVATFFAGLKEIVALWMKRVLLRMKRKTYIQSVERLAQFLDLFETIKGCPDVQRCLIFRGRNCGGLPTPGKPYTVKAVHGWCTKPDKEDPLKEYDFELQVDGHYIRMLEDMLKNGKTVKTVSKMPDDAKLKAYYLSEGLKCLVIFYLGIIDSELIYLSVGSYDAEAISDQVQGRVQLVVDRMKSLIGEPQ